LRTSTDIVVENILVFSVLVFSTHYMLSYKKALYKLIYDIGHFKAK